MPLAPFASPRSVSRAVAEIMLPPRRIRPSVAVGRYLRTEKGAWNADLASMMIEPLDLLQSRKYTGICYVGPARGSKTMTLILGSLTYIVTCSPGDTQITQMSQDAAREFSKKEIDRAIRHSPELAARLSPRPRDDNVFDKFFRSGMALNLGWPTVTQHSSKTLKYTLITDYDRPENRDDVDGEGTLWDVAYARIRTFMSRGKCLAESSPGGEYKDPKWRPTSLHEAPPATGILAIYNRGTRARWYWKCIHCKEYFEAKPGLDCFELPDFEELEQEVQKRDLMWLAEQFARIACPHCRGVHEIQHKPELNLSGRWLHAGESINAAGEISGERRRTDIASFWQGGCSASYQRWDQLLMRYFQGILTFLRTGDEGSLKATTNTDQAAPYLSRSVAKRRSAEELLERVEDWTQGVIPAGVRFLTGSVDVQSNRFVVQVHGWGVGLESWLIDRFVIKTSARDNGERLVPIDPASYAEDWDVLVDALLLKQYPLEHAPELRLSPKLIFGDSGGREGVTEKAYEFWRRLKQKNLHRKFILVKGASTLSAPRAHLSWPDTRDRKDRNSGARGDVPVYLLNTHVIKDGIAGDLQRKTPGPGFIHLPRWVETEYFDELTAETRDRNGRWIRQAKVANEALDLHVYARAACIVLKAESINWHSPPAWAAPFESRPPVTRLETDPSPRKRRMRSRGIS